LQFSKPSGLSSYTYIRFLVIVPMLSIVSQWVSATGGTFAELNFMLCLLGSLAGLSAAIALHPIIVSFARPDREEFSRLTEDILHNAEFLKLKDYVHHRDRIYDHVLRVAYLSYFISRILGLDYIATARGGLLHDFFLYDWRKRKATDRSRWQHGREHPFVALANARRNFEINDMEADIIVKHMFPKTRAVPRYRESFVVSFSDKVSAIYEYLYHPSGSNR
jgi:uncharacterized protein